MTTVSLSPILNATQQFDNNGQPLAGGYIYFYQAGSYTVLQNIYSDAAGTVPLANPVILDSTGRVPTEVWIDTLLTYNVVLTKSDGTSIIKNWDNISASAISGGTGVLSLTAGTGIALSSSTGAVTISSTVDEWNLGGAPSYVNASTFTVPLDKVTTYTAGRRIKASVTAGTVFGTIISSVYTTFTTVTVSMDLGSALDTGLSAVWYGLIESIATPASLHTQIIPISGAGTLLAIDSGATCLVSDSTAAYDITLPAPIAGMNFTFIGGGVGTYQVGFVYTGSLYFADGTSYSAGSYEAINLSARGSYVTIVSPDGINWQVEGMPVDTPSSYTSIAASVAASALTITLNPCRLAFKNPITTDGIPVYASIISPISITVPSTATLGTTSGVGARLYVVVAYNSGAPILCVTNSEGGVNLSEDGYISPTTISTGATSASVVYSSASVGLNSPYRIVGALDVTEPTAGTWITAPTNAQGIGGQALMAMSSLGYGQVWKAVTRTTGVTYYNTTGKPICVSRIANNTNATATYITATINGFTFTIAFGLGATVTGGCSGFVVIPPNSSYLFSDVNNTSPASTQELN